MWHYSFCSRWFKCLVLILLGYSFLSKYKHQPPQPCCLSPPPPHGQCMHLGASTGNLNHPSKCALSPTSLLIIADQILCILCLVLCHESWREHIEENYRSLKMNLWNISTESWGEALNLWIDREANSQPMSICTKKIPVPSWHSNTVSSPSSCISDFYCTSVNCT